MANPSVSIPDEILERLDDRIWELKTDGEIPRDTSRSEVITMIIDDWADDPFVTDYIGSDEGNPTPAVQPAD